MNKNNLIKILKQEVAILSDFVNGFTDSESIHPKEVEIALSKVRDIYDELSLLGEVTPPELKVDGKQNKPEGNFLIPSKAGDDVPVKMQEPDDRIPIPEIEMVSILASESIEVPEAALDTITLLPNTKDENIHLAADVSSDEVANTQIPIEIPAPNTAIEIENPVPQVVPEIKIEAPVNLVSVDNEMITQDSAQSKNETIADKFSNGGPSVNDMLSGIKQNKDLASKLQDRPIKDLKKAIKLNDRIWFINELFHKNAATFEATIAKINDMDNLDAALEYLFTHFKWDQERKSTISFLELIFRRFAS